MKAIVVLLGLVIGALAVTQAHRPTTLPSHPTRPVYNPPTTPVKYRYYCSRYRNQRCQRYSAPTCGWYDQKKVKCHTFPCAINYSNPCVACNNHNIKYVTCEACPHTNTPVANLNYHDSSSGRFPTCMNHN